MSTTARKKTKSRDEAGKACSQVEAAARTQTTPCPCAPAKMKLITIVCAVLPFAFVGGIVNLNLAVWRHGNDPAVFVDFFFGAITCLVIGSGIGRWIFNKGEKQKDSTCEVVGSAATFDTMLGPDFEPSFLKSVLVF